jgi:acetyltransferase-like isoleucine patch superfamily enzyme
MTQKPILLIGVRTDNRGVLSTIEAMGRTVAGFVDKFYVGQTIDNVPVIASELELLDTNSKLYQEKDNYDWFVSTIFTGVTNVKVDNENSWLLRNGRAEIARKANLNLINVRHPNSFIDPTCIVGTNNFIGWGCYFGGYCKIGDFNFFGYNCGLALHVYVGDFCTLIGSTFSVSNVTIGDNVFMGPTVTISKTTPDFVNIGNNVIIAAGSTIMRSIDNNRILFANGRTLTNKKFAF